VFLSTVNILAANTHCKYFLKIAQHTRSKKKTTFYQHARVGTAGETVLFLPRSLACRFLCAHAHNSQTPRRWNCEAHSSIERFLFFFINWGMATDIKLKDYILYKYKERIEEKKTHYIICYR
jgi:hypothetical protein